MRVKAVKYLALVLGIGLAAGIGAENISYRQAADMLYLVMSADRTAYTRKVVQRLARDEEVITASEHYEDDSALPLPAQMFRFGAELVADATEDFSYSLLSFAPNQQEERPRHERGAGRAATRRQQPKRKLLRRGAAGRPALLRCRLSRQGGRGSVRTLPQQPQGFAAHGCQGR